MIDHLYQVGRPIPTLKIIMGYLMPKSVFSFHHFQEIVGFEAAHDNESLETISILRVTSLNANNHPTVFIILNNHIVI